MTTFNDTLYMNIIADTKGAENAFTKMDSKMREFQNNLGKTQGLSKFQSKLKDVGLSLGKNGQIYQKGTAGAISQAKAIGMIIEKEKQLIAVKAEANALTAQPSGLKELQSISEIGRQIGMLANQGIDVNEQIDEMNKRFASSPQYLNAFNASLKKAQNMFDMSTLSWIFGGMALQHMGLVMTRFLIPSMDQLQKLNNESAKKTMAVGAAFEFLKISMFETLAQTPLFQSFVEWIVKGAIGIAEFTQKNPKLIETAAILGSIATILGTAALGVGLFKQITYLGDLSGLSASFKASFDFLLSPVGAGTVLAAVMGLATLSFDDTRSSINEIFGKMTDLGTDLFQTLADILGLDVKFGSFWHTIGNAGVKTFAAIGVSMAYFVTGLEGIAIVIKELSLLLLSTLGEAILVIMKHVRSLIKLWNQIPALPSIDTKNIDNSINNVSIKTKAMENNIATSFASFSDAVDRNKQKADVFKDIVINGVDSKYLKSNSSLIEQNAISMDKFANSIDKAASAQEKLNRAIGQGQSKIPSLFQQYVKEGYDERQKQQYNSSITSG